MNKMAARAKNRGPGFEPQKYQGWAVETTPGFNQRFQPVITALVNTP